jgi:hypothetical protein
MRWRCSIWQRRKSRAARSEDSFNGGYLGALFTGASLAQAMQAGHDLAANVGQHPWSNHSRREPRGALGVSQIMVYHFYGST